MPEKLADQFPECQHVRDIGLHESQDIEVWNYAKDNGYLIVTKDLDFQQRSLLLGHPPKVLRLRVGNCTVQSIEDILRLHSRAVSLFALDDAKSFLALP